MRRRLKILLGLAAIAAVLALVLVAKLVAPDDSTANLLAAPVVRGTIEQTVEAAGTLHPRELVSVGAQVSGRIEVLDGRGGDLASGQLIAQIDAQQQTNALQSARAELANMQAQRASRQAALALAEKALHRQDILIPGEATSMADYEAARAHRDAALAERDH